MHQNTRLLPASRTRSLPRLIAALCCVLAGTSHAQSLVIDFTSPATHNPPNRTFSGNLTWSPADLAITKEVLAGSSVVPESAVVVTGTGANQRVEMTRNLQTSGLVTVRLTGTQDTNTVQTTFIVNFLPNQPPTINLQPTLVMNEDGSTDVSFTISDPEAQSMTVSASTSNSTLFPSFTFPDNSGTTRSIRLAPAANENDNTGTTTVSVTVSDGEMSATGVMNVTVIPVNDAPTVCNFSAVSVNDNVSSAILPNISIADLDNFKPTEVNLTVTVTVADGFGTLPGGGTTFVTSGNITTVVNALRAMQFTPIANRVTPGSTETMGVTVTVNDGTVSPSFNQNVTITSVNDAPVVVGGLNPTSTTEGSIVQPFFLSSVADADQNDSVFDLVVELVNPAQSVFGSFVTTNAVSGATVAGMQSFLENLAFATASGVITNNSESVAFRYRVTDGFGGTTSITNSLTIFAQQTAPNIFGVPIQTVNLTDSPVPYTPFPSVSVSDVDEGGLQTVRAVLSSSVPAMGSFSQTSFPYSSQAQLTLDLRSVTFTPNPGVLAVNSTTNVVLTITAEDSTGLTTANNNVVLSIKAVNNAPQILQVPALAQQPVLLPPVDPIRPFANLGLSNDDPDNVTVTITLDDTAKGTLTNLGGFTQLPSGSYRMVGQVPAILASLTNLAFEVSGSYLFPQDDPGGTTFTLSAADSVLLTSTKTLYIQVQDEPRNHLVTRAVNDGLPGSLTFALANARNNDVITFALPAYPALIRMPGTAGTLITRNITLKGPGADLLTLSGDNNGDEVADRQLFRIASRVTMEGLTLSHGTASLGGAVQVQEGGALTMRFCAIVHSRAESYGGAIDVDGGALTLENCFIGFNQVSEENGLGGAGISVYTDEDILITNTTFSRNQLLNENADGGAALVAENLDNGTPMNVRLVHCTFAENLDASGTASGVLSIGFGTYVRPRACLFQDASGRNLEVSGTGSVISDGANVADDSTRTILGQQGAVGDALLDHVTDLTDTDANLAPLVQSGRPTPYYPLLTGSPAVGLAAGSATLVDQRGVLRVSPADSGAAEQNALRRLVLNEIDFDDSTLDFVEIFVPRDAAPISLAPYSLYVDGVRVHDFSSSFIIGTNETFALNSPANTLLNPGFGIVVAFTSNAVSVTSSVNPTPVVRPSVSVPNLAPRGTIAIGLTSSGVPIVQSTYLGVYLDPLTGTNTLDTTGMSISLAPQFLGHALVPHSYLLAGPLSGIDPNLTLATGPNSIGADAYGTPFGLDNAQPRAFPDVADTTEDDRAVLDPLANDFDSDGNDRLVIVDVSTASAPGAGDAATGTSQLGATLTILPSSSPLRGSSISYDPRSIPFFQELPVGVEVLDTFYYEILDIGSAPVEGFPAGTSTNTLVTATSHRLNSGDSIRISGSSVPGYNQTFVATVIDEHSFSIPTTYAGPAAVNGIWETTLPRTPTARSEASFSVNVTGVNDAPVARPDRVDGVFEHDLIRIMTRPELAGSVLSFPTDPAATPLMTATNLLFNDLDVDSDETWDTMRVVGVLGAVHDITAYSGIADAAPVTVHAPGHGLNSGEEILIANYGGHPSYNGQHVITVLNADEFTIPRYYQDDDAEKGVWVILNDSNRYETVTDVGATVRLTLRADPREDHLLYDADASLFLNGLAEGETYTNRFFYAVEDHHGAVGIGEIHLVVTGLNDTPVASDDPDDLGLLDALVTSSNSLESVLADGLDLLYLLPAASGATNQVNLQALDRSGTLPGTLVVTNLWFTDEETALQIQTVDLLANDRDADRIDSPVVAAVETKSREGADLTLLGNVIQYVPSVSSNLQALARGEFRVDTFDVAVSDGNTGGTVTSLVAVLVIGLNDQPEARPDFISLTEDDVFVFNPIQHPTGTPALHDSDVDINGATPDDRLTMLVATNLLTPGLARVDILPSTAEYDATVSETLNQLADWQTYTDTFPYTVTDNSDFFVLDDQFHVPVDSVGAVLDVLANDRDLTPAGGTLLIVELSPTLNGGTVNIASNSLHLLYSSPPSVAGDDYFSYTVENDAGDRRSARVHVRTTIPALNGILHAADDQFTAAYGETVVLNVLANDHMLPNGAASLVLSPVVYNSSVPGQPVFDGTHFVYTATNGLNRLTFGYEISAGGTATARAAVTVDIVDRRGSLDVQNDQFSVQPNSIGNELDVLANDALLTAPTDGLRVRAILDPAQLGTIATNATGTALLYSPFPGVLGVERLRYEATDTIGGTATGLVEVVIGRIDTATDFYTVSIASTGTAVELNVLANDRVLPFPATALELVSVSPSTPTTIGTLAVNGTDTRLQFTPTGVVGQQTFSYTVRDGSIPPRTAVGQVTIATVPNGRYGNTDRFIVRSGSNDNVLDVLANDITHPNTNKSYSLLSIGVGPDAPNAGGTVTIVDNKLSYTPAPGFVGEERFTYLMSDSVGTDSADVTVSVRRGDLMSNGDHYAVFFELDGSEAQSFVLPVLLNDRIQPALDQVTQIVGIGVGTNAPNQGGSLSIAADGLSLVYRPVLVPSPRYVERFTYEISDGTDRRASAVVEVQVSARAGDLEAITMDDAYTVARNSLNNTLAVLQNDAVLPGSAGSWSLTAVGTPANGGTAVINGSSIRYTPAADFVGVDSFTYSVSDGLGGTGSATVQVRVGDLPLLPDLFVALAGSSGNEFRVLANDLLDPAYAGEYRLHSVFDPDSGGSVSRSPSNTVVYAPDPLFAGPFPAVEQFSYRIADDSGVLSTGTVRVLLYDPDASQSTTTVTALVQGVNDIPVILNTPTEPAITDKETALPFLGVTLIEVDEQLQERIDIQVSLPNPAQGTLSTPIGVNDLGGGQYSITNVTAAAGTSLLAQMLFTPTENRITVPTTETTRFHITVTDNKSAPVTDTNSVVHVTAVNDAPTIVGTVTGQEFHYRLPISPFTTVLISEVDDLTLQPLDLTITVQPASNGSLTNLGGFVQTTPGEYTFTNTTAAAGTAALRALEFVSGTNLVPVGGALETRFLLAVDDRFAAPVLDDATTVIARNADVASVRPTDTLVQGSFGLEVDAIDAFAIVGAPNSNTNGVNAGSAFLYRLQPGSTNTWEEWRHLQPATVTENDRFGRSVAITESSAAVGAIQSATNGVETGAVYLFDRDLGASDNWGERLRIVPAGITNAVRFGFSVALHGDLLAVGAPDARLNPANPVSGAVFVYERNAGGPDQWGEVFRWAPTDTGSTTALFGWSVALTDGRLVVGAPQYNADGDATREGAAYVFNRASGSGTWSMAQRLTSNELNLSLEFGWDVSAHTDLLAVSAPSMSAGGVVNAGRVFLYAPLNVTQVVEVAQLDRRSDNERRFGHSVSLKQDSVFVGAPHNNGPQNIGAAYLFQRDPLLSAQWNMAQKLNRPAGSTAGLYGTSVSFKRGTAAVGAPSDLSVFNNRGFTYFYRFGFNQNPQLLVALPDQFVWLGEPVSLPIDPETFLDPDEDDILTRSVEFLDGGNGLNFTNGVIEGVPLALGVFRVELRATDLAGASTSHLFEIHVLNPGGGTNLVRQAWEAANFPGVAGNPALAATVWGGSANPEGDAANNDQEYAFGGNPNAMDSVAIELEPNGLGNLFIRYNRRTNDPSLTFALEKNFNQTGWVNADASIVAESTVTLNPEVERVTLTVQVIAPEPDLLYRIFVTF